MLECKGMKQAKGIAWRVFLLFFVLSFEYSIVCADTIMPAVYELQKGGREGGSKEVV